MTLAIYNCLWTPLTVSFDYAIKLDKESTFQSIDQAINVVYAADIVVQFLTSYYDVRTGDPIRKPRMIAKRYIRGEFTIDFLSTFPFNVLGIKHSLY